MHVPAGSASQPAVPHLHVQLAEVHTAASADGGHPGTCPGLQTECLWPWGSTDNTVWEGVGVGATAKLAAGTAQITITLMHTVPHGVELGTAHFADRFEPGLAQPHHSNV